MGISFETKNVFSKKHNLEIDVNDGSLERSPRINRDGEIIIPYCELKRTYSPDSFFGPKCQNYDELISK